MVQQFQATSAGFAPAERGRLSQTETPCHWLFPLTPRNVEGGWNWF